MPSRWTSACQRNLSQTLSKDGRNQSWNFPVASWANDCCLLSCADKWWAAESCITVNEVPYLVQVPSSSTRNPTFPEIELTLVNRTSKSGRAYLAKKVIPSDLYLQSRLPPSWRNVVLVIPSDLSLQSRLPPSWRNVILSLIVEAAWKWRLPVFQVEVGRVLVSVPGTSTARR